MDGNVQVIHLYETTLVLRDTILMTYIHILVVSGILDKKNFVSVSIKVYIDKFFDTDWI